LIGDGILFRPFHGFAGAAFGVDNGGFGNAIVFELEDEGGKAVEDGAFHFVELRGCAEFGGGGRDDAPGEHCWQLLLKEG